MKQKLLLALLCLFGMLSANAQRSYTFNATALNVDGLPNKILTFEINPDGKEAAGATELCGILANSGWDIVGFSEDFNFHDYLTAAPASNYYNFGAHGGKVSSTSNSTDGLGFACSKLFSMSGGSRTEWSTYYGGSGLPNVGDNGADGMIAKGFRMYTVTIATGVAVDVYVLHMDANTADSDDDYDSNGKDKNIVAREAQLAQLAAAIKTNIANNKRPAIVLGDTNCRYTREALKAGFIDVINAVSGLTIKDAWVELMWGGTYPTYGADAMMTGEYGMQRGEVVDKVFYINTTASNLTLKANSYLHDESVTVSDHKPVVVNFTVTDNNGTPLTDAEKEENWTLEEQVKTNEKPTWKGEQVVSGTTYYLMNVGTGRYIKRAGWWYSQAVTGNSGHPITPTLNNGKYELVTIASEGRSLGTGLFMDNTDHNTWTLTPVSGTSYQYYIEADNGALSTSGTADLAIVTKNESDENQKWIFVTESGMLTAMADANSDYPFNFTPMLQAAEFDDFDNWGLGGIAASNWTNFTSAGFSIGGGVWGAGMDKYNFCAVANTKNNITISQSLETLPTGYYNVSFEAFYRSRTSSADETLSGAAVNFGSNSIAIPNNQNTEIGAGTDQVAAIFRDNDTYRVSQQIQLASATNITLSVTKPNTSSTQSAWVCIDDFYLRYYGASAVADPNAEFKSTVLEYVNAMYPNVLKLNDAGQAAYDITIVTYRYNNDMITSAADAQAMCDIVDAAYANAYAAHYASIVEDVVADMNNNGGDVTGAIINPSFETGDLTGWTISKTDGDVNVYPNSNGTYTASGCDGSYLFNSWGWPDEGTSSAKLNQTVKGLPNGLYELKASLTSFGKADGKPYDYTVFLTANSRYAGVVATGGKTVFHEATLYFLVEDGMAEIGAVGSDGTEFNYFDPRDGSFFKADNFRLKYICDVPNGRLKLALDEANATTLDFYGQKALNISAYETMYANKSVTGDGTAEVEAVYAAMNTASKAQMTKGADMTWTIENPSFETGDYTPWTTTVGWDTRVAIQNSSYVAVGAAGAYLFNTWNDDGNATNSGVNAPITQTISGLPNGTYQLTAMMASGGGNTLYVSGNGTQGTVAAQAADFMKKASVEFAVTDGTATISAGGSNNVWYKVDDFRLTLVAPAELVLEETATSIVPIENVTYPKVTLKRTIKPNTWSTFVSPFDIPASVLEDGDWDVKELSSATENAGHVSLVFTDSEDGIKKGVPYMVRNTSLGENLTAITMENVEVNTVTLNNVDGGAVKFVGQYISENVPVGDFFISSNTFYQAEDNTNTMKGFRARFVPASAGVKSLSYSFDDVDFTGIEGVEGNAAEIIAIYGVDGTLRSDLQKGINIVKMSNGTTKKVLVK